MKDHSIGLTYKILHIIEKCIKDPVIPEGMDREKWISLLGLMKTGFQNYIRNDLEEPGKMYEFEQAQKVLALHWKNLRSL